ncbi:hypothetical protein HMPREF0401_00151 [Fusobacterium animalis 11_3_2]|uniref:Riboflavin synthase subunit alpha n=1 Tax=Fusobacterium animalis 11_3_2 TaxID=457403 RepID=F7KX30_9FUSO|nr:hypothetical protein HMPREF0401_00151 [Fusobacterium animalis 11_3_2]
MSRANLAVFERREFSEFAANVNFSSLRNLASNKLFLVYLAIIKFIFILTLLFLNKPVYQ